MIGIEGKQLQLNIDWSLLRTVTMIASNCWSNSWLNSRKFIQLKTYTHVVNKILIDCISTIQAESVYIERTNSIENWIYQLRFSMKTHPTLFLIESSNFLFPFLIIFYLFIISVLFSFQNFFCSIWRRYYTL